MPEIRPFDPAAISSAIDKAIASLPADVNGAVIAYADRDQASLGVIARVGSQWTFVGKLGKPYRGELTAEAEVRWTW